MDFNAWLIPLLVLVPLVTALAMLVRTDWFDRPRNAWGWGLGSTLVTFVISLVIAWRFDWGRGGDMQFAGMVEWIPAFGLSFGYGMDSISLWLVLLTTFLMPIVMLGSLTAVASRVREFYFWLLLLQAAMVGVFVATDILFFYLCFEFTLIPLYFLIGVYGSAERLKAARMFFLYTFAGSMLTLAGLIYVAWFNASLPAGAAAVPSAGQWTFDIQSLYAAAQAMAPTQQAWVLAALLAGFAVKVPLWPVHTWLPLAHTEAPTAGSVVLAGVLLKLGTYALLRFALPMTPEAIVDFAPWIGALAVVGILYTALVCWVQSDIKKLIAYSSVSHLGFCVLGLFALDAANIGASGAVLYMVNHGLSTGALFLCVGMIYERFHTREMALMGGLARVMPVWAFFLGFFVMASVGLPGLNGFVSEFLTLLATFLSPQSVLGYPYAVAAAFGLIFAAIYLLYMLGRVLFGPVLVPAHGEPGHAAGPVADLNGREILTLTPLAIGCVVLGLMPWPLLQSLDDAVAAMTSPAQAVVAQRYDEQLAVEAAAGLPPDADRAASAAPTYHLTTTPLRLGDEVASTWPRRVPSIGPEAGAPAHD
ncbi:MAG: NADH-quinone oxidoreductase subunit M [Phycisphaeraceae bacterium]